MLYFYKTNKEKRKKDIKKGYEFKVIVIFGYRYINEKKIIFKFDIS